MNGPLFLIPMLIGLVAQAVKPLLNKQWYASLKHEGRHIPRYGGMPSAHTAFAMSLATLVALEDGIYSTAFMIAVSVVIYVLDDALRMRIFLSRHGLALRKLISRLSPEEQAEYPYLEARLGHRIREVLVGGLFGVAITIALWFIYYALIQELLTTFFIPV